VGVLLKVHVRCRDRIGMAPARQMVARHAEEAAETELSASGHGRHSSGASWSSGPRASGSLMLSRARWKRAVRKTMRA
jgi:hypothetical protein